MNRILSIICLLNLTSCTIFSNSTTIGEAKVTFENNEIFVSNFPHYSMGISSWGANFGVFSFDKLDEFIYKVATQTANSQYIYITIQTMSTDKYGNVSADTPITIGKIEVAESKRYTDFYHWQRELKHQTERMFWKDEREYNEQYQLRAGEQLQFQIAPAYMPKSIRSRF